MLRASVAIFAGLIVVSVLAMLIVASRSVDDSYYSDYAGRSRAVESSREQIETFRTAVTDAFADGRAIPPGAALALERLVAQNTTLQAPGDEAVSPVATELATYDAALAVFRRNADTLQERQNAFAAALRSVQEDSATVVRELREFDLRAQAQNTFVLALDIVEFASGQSEIQPQQLLDRLAAVEEDPRVRQRIPRLASEFSAAATTVLEQRPAVSDAIDSLGTAAAIDALNALAEAMTTANRVRIARAERARMLLYVFTLLLLGGVAYVAYRLQASYRALNRSNAELATMNDSLEERVNARTEELRSAYEELKESQVQLVQAEKMSSLGELVAGISHEINTPLWYLINNATIIEERLQTSGRFARTADAMIDAVTVKNADSRERLAQGLKEMRRLLAEGLKDDILEASDLVRDSIEGLEELSELAKSLKDFSRLDRAQTGTFNVNEGLDRTLLIARNKLKNRITVNKEFGSVPSIRGMPSQVNQVFLNLITNAADAIGEEGAITIKTWSHDDGVSISIADTGCGIAAENMSKIRDPFFTTKEVGKGTGLGLSIVHRIVSEHGGKLDIESEVGSGTTVTVTLPLGQEAGDEGDENVPLLLDVADAVDSDGPEALNDANLEDGPPRAATV